MGVKKLHLVFDNQTAVFSPGQSVSGRILMANSGSIKIRSIRLKFRGEAKTSWTEQKSRKKPDGKTLIYTERYYAEEVYFEIYLTLIGGEGKLELKEGEHVYPFNTILPHQLPSTFKGEHGHVRYTAIVTVIIPWRINKENETTFQVISPLNLNHDPLLAKPKKVEKEKFYCCCLCKSGPMTLVAWIPYSGFVPGQIIPLTVELDNNSNVEIDAVKIYLKRYLKFISIHPSCKTNSFKSEFEILTLQGIKSRASKTWTKSIMIPNNFMIPNLEHCNIITVDYVLKVKAIVDGMHRNTDVNMNITMGNIPLTIVQDAPQYSIPALDVDHSSNGQFTTNATNRIHLTVPVPGFAQQISPNGQPSFISPYPPLSAIPARFTGRPPLCIKKIKAYNKSQLPYPGLNIQ